MEPKAKTPTLEQAQKFKVKNPKLILAQEQKGYAPRGPLTPAEWEAALDKEHEATLQMERNAEKMARDDAEMCRAGAIQVVAEMRELFAASRARQAAHGPYTPQEMADERRKADEEYAAEDREELAKIQPDVTEIVEFPRVPLRAPREDNPAMSRQERDAELDAQQAEQEEVSTEIERQMKLGTPGKRG